MDRPTQGWSTELFAALAILATAAALSACVGRPDELGTTTTASAYADSPTQTTTARLNTTATASSQPAPTVDNNAALWDVVGAVVNQMPLNNDSFGRALGAPLASDGQGTNSWSSNTVIQLTDGVQIIRSEVWGIPNGQWGKNSTARFAVGGRCVSLDEIKNHYPDLRITQTPRGPNEGPPLGYSTDQPWGQLNFDVNDSLNPPCLLAVSLTPFR